MVAPTVPRPADYVTSPQTSLSSLSTGGNTNDTDFDMEFSLDWSPVEFPELFGEGFGRVFPSTSAEEAPPCSSVHQITVMEDWDTEAVVEQSIDSTSPVLVVPPDVMIVDVVAPQRPVSPPPPPPPEPFWERPPLSTGELASSIVDWMDLRPDDDADARPGGCCTAGRPLKRTAACHPIFDRFVNRNTSTFLQHHRHELNRCLWTFAESGYSVRPPLHLGPARCTVTENGPTRRTAFLEDSEL